MGFIVPNSKATASYNANWTAHKWGIAPKDVLHFSFQFSLDDQDLIRAAGYQTPLSVVVRVEGVPQYSDIPLYFENLLQYYPIKSFQSYMRWTLLLYLSPNANLSIIEFRLDNAVYSEQNFFSLLVEDIDGMTSLLTDYIGFFHYGRNLIFPTDILDYATTQFINGKTEKAADIGFSGEFKVEYSATYFRVEQQFKFVYETEAISSMLEFSRKDGVLNEYESKAIRDFDEGDAEYYGITPGTHTIKMRIERLPMQRIGYHHSQTPGFAFLLAILSFCTYCILKKRKKLS
jgi:hypothetical protein